MRPFGHRSARTIQGAVRLLKTQGGKAKIIAGGTDLLGTLKDRILPDYPETLINIKTIPGLDQIREEGGRLRIGSLATLATIAESPLVKGKYRLLAQAAGAVAAPQIRRMATIGGNLCQDLRCWYYRYPHHVGGRLICTMKAGSRCYALTGENQYHSIFGASRVSSPPCSSHCPGAPDIPRYLSMIREGDLAGAAGVVLDANPLPAITGRVCPHFCQEGCNRCDFDESVSIGGIERFMGDYILERAGEIMGAAAPETGRHVAVVGSGPAGLSAAYYLRRYGHKVTVFDRMEKAGGMLTYGIPAHRLPKDVVARTVEAIAAGGVTFKLEVALGRDVTLGDLQRDFDSLFLATGAWLQPATGLTGEEFTRSGIDVLTEVNRGRRNIPGDRIVVIGGGNVAVDVAITAKRLGAREVTIVYRRTREEMPALREEIERALEEGITIRPSRSPVKVLRSQGRITGLEVVRSASVTGGEGSRGLTLDETERESIEADHIIMAVGQAPDLAFLGGASTPEVRGNLLVVDGETQETTVKGLFAGGEVTVGPSTVIEAIAAGRRAAAAMNRYLGGRDERPAVGGKEKAFLTFHTGCLIRSKRAEPARLPIDKRGIDLEDALGLSRHQIESEANRCFNCGCLAVNSSDMAAALLALDARIKIANRRGLLPIRDFFGTPGKLPDGASLVTEIQVPEPPAGARQTFLKFRLREAIDFSIVSVASLITVEKGVCRDARIVLGGVAPAPIRAVEAERMITGKPLDEAAAARSAEAALAGATPLYKNGFKIEIAKALIKRALTAA